MNEKQMYYSIKLHSKDIIRSEERQVVLCFEVIDLHKETVKYDFDVTIYCI